MGGGLLLPLAYARGSGIPWADVWLPLANALKPEGAPAYTHSDFEWIRTHASSYVIGITSGESPRSVYRLYHRSFGDFLRKDERYARGDYDQHGDEHKIVAALLPGALALCGAETGLARPSTCATICLSTPPRAATSRISMSWCSIQRSLLMGAMSSCAPRWAN